MDPILDRLINVGGAFLLLSLVVEKIADFLKLGNEKLRVKLHNQGEEKARAQAILKRNIIIGIALAFFMKADALQMLTSGEPGEVIGWENVLFLPESDSAEMSAMNYSYFSALRFSDVSGAQSVFTWIQLILGIVVAGLSLSFGSKFWHDLVGILYEVKEAKARMKGK